MRYVWDYFLHLNRKRTSNGFSANALSYSEIESFFRLMQIEVMPEEVMLIDMLDGLALEHYANEAEKNKSNNKHKK